jgi:hypothetical protein
MLVTSIITRLPPAIDGVGDYALKLAVQLRHYFDIQTRFVVSDPKWIGTTQIEGFPITQLPVCSAEALLSLLPSDRRGKCSDETECQQPLIVLLHYVNYGYAKRGCPVWLVDGLQRWLALDVKRSLITMFHEVYAQGFPPWTSSFWLSPIQRNLATRLAQLSSRCLTSRRDYAQLLDELSKGKHPQIPTLAIFSNVGEPDRVLPLEKRSRKIVIFGGSDSRTKVYQNSSRELSYACQLLGIEKIVDIGPPTELTLSAIGGVTIVEMGQLSAPRVSGILSQSIAGFFDYIPGYLAKSGIFAAYCAHGLLPISARYNPSLSDGIQAGEHYWIPEQGASELECLRELQAITDNAHTWYQNHQSSVHAKLFAQQLFDLI